jgi:hypothetical protein
MNDKPSTWNGGRKRVSRSQFALRAAFRRLGGNFETEPAVPAQINYVEREGTRKSGWCGRDPDYPECGLTLAAQLGKQPGPREFPVPQDRVGRDL